MMATKWNAVRSVTCGHLRAADDLGCPAFDKASKMGKYKLDLAVRAMFPR